MIAGLSTWARALRVEQWTKNGVVMMAWFFSVADASQREIVRGWESFLMAVAMAGAFSLVSSAFYLLNDVSDYEADRLHPVKRNRPVAADLISRITAVRAALVLFAVGFAYPALVVILLNKCDLVDEETLRSVSESVRSFNSEAELCLVSAKEGITNEVLDKVLGRED